MMEFVETAIPGLILIRPERHTDARGHFMETYRKATFDQAIGDITFVQDNQSQSSRDVLRGLHLQTGDSAQAKLVRVVEGSVFDVAVDLRPSSPSFGRWFGTELSADNNIMMFIPRGFAHGFLVLSEKATFIYKVDNYYDPHTEITIKYDDPSINVKWPLPVQSYILSDKDLTRAVSLKEYLTLKKPNFNISAQKK